MWTVTNVSSEGKPTPIHRMSVVAQPSISSRGLKPQKSGRDLQPIVFLPFPFSLYYAATGGRSGNGLYLGTGATAWATTLTAARLVTVGPCPNPAVSWKLEKVDCQQTNPGRRGCDWPVAREDDIPSSSDRDVRLLRLLGAMPFLDRIELSQVAGEANQRVYEEIADLEELGVVAGVSHGSPLLAPTRRYHLTLKGVAWLADINGVSQEEALRCYPVSRRWQRLLLARLDAVGVIYRAAANVTIAAGGLAGMDWYRSRALDAALHLPGDWTVGILRQGATTDRTGFSKRAWRLREEGGPQTVLVLASD